jgi:hypothetical protein
LYDPSANGRYRHGQVKATKVAAYLGLGIALSLAASAIGAAGFVGSSGYNTAADDHHTKPVLVIIETLRA